MSLTRAQAESILVGRRLKTLALLGLSTATDGTNEFVAYPLACSLRLLGGTTVDPTVAEDDDLATLPASIGVDRLIALADIEMIEWILGNWYQVTFSLGGHSESLSDLLTALQKTLERLKADYVRKYPIDVVVTEATSTSGVRVGRVCRVPWAGSPRRSWWGC